MRMTGDPSIYSSLWPDGIEDILLGEYWELFDGEVVAMESLDTYFEAILSVNRQVTGRASTD